MANNDLQSSVTSVTKKLAKALGDASALNVETRYVLLSAPDADTSSDEKGRLLARTTMELDGDTTVLMPMTRNAAGELQTNQEIFELHQSNVKTALEYRSNLLNTLLDAVRSLT